MLKVIYGSITNEEETLLIDNMGIIVDKQVGSILKYGDINTSDILNYYHTMLDKYRAAGLDDIADDLVFISFDRYNGKITIEEICTIVNYGMNSHSERFLEIYNLEETALHERIKQLQNYGY